MTDFTARRQRQLDDLSELRVKAARARQDIRDLPAPADRTAAQREKAWVRRYLLLLTRIALNGLHTPTADDLDDTGVEG